MQNHLLLLSVLVITALVPSLSHAQVCGSDGRALFQCVFENTTQQVTICLANDAVRYALGTVGEEPVVQLSQGVDSISYTAGAPDGSKVRELAFYAKAGVHHFVFAPTIATSTTLSIISNTKERRDYTCAPASITPQDPKQGIGQLIPILSDGQGRLAACRKSAEYRENPTACLGRIQKACRLIFASTGQPCEESELDVWNGLMAEALAKVVAHYNDTDFTAKMIQAQKIWETSRVADCAVAGGTVFNTYVPEVGEQECLIYLAAQRLRFLEVITHDASLR